MELTRTVCFSLLIHRDSRGFYATTKPRWQANKSHIIARPKNDKKGAQQLKLGTPTGESIHTTSVFGSIVLFLMLEVKLRATRDNSACHLSIWCSSAFLFRILQNITSAYRGIEFPSSDRMTRREKERSLIAGLLC